MRNTLRISFQQAFRSSALIILPLAFGSLVVWATAGSGSGKTSDPLRASIWLWLAANHVPFRGDNVGATAWLSYLPLGTLFLIFAALRSGFLRASARISPQGARETNLILITLSISYALIATSLSLVTSESTITFPWYLTFLITFLEASVATYLASELRPDHPHRRPWQVGVKTATITLLILWGIATLITALSLIFHFSDVRALTTVIQPGIFGGVTFLAIQILYLPNVTMAAFSYIAGAGFQIGSGSWIHPLTHRLAEIPALPILGALPTRSNPIALFAVLLPIAGGWWAARAIRNRHQGVAYQQATVSFLLSALILITVLSFLSSGSLFNRELSYVGPMWFFSLLLTGELAFGLFLSQIISKKIQ